MLLCKGWNKTDIIAFKNLGAEEIKIKLSSLKQYGRPHCLVVFILSHGEYGVIYGSDGQPVDIQKDVIYPLSEDKCKELRGIPKLFFFQSCQEEVPRTDSDGSESSDENNSETIYDEEPREHIDEGKFAIHKLSCYLSLSRKLYIFMFV